jgi:putative sterol carrier protein
MAAEVFKSLDAAVKANPDQAKKINGVFQWSIDGKDYLIDLKKMNAGPGKADKADVTLTLTEKDFLDVMSGKGNAQQMFMSGKIKFKGNMGMVS